MDKEEIADKFFIEVEESFPGDKFWKIIDKINKYFPDLLIELKLEVKEKDYVFQEL